MVGPREAPKRYRLRGRASPVAPTWPRPGQSRWTYNPAPLLSRWPRDLTRKSPMPKHLTLAELTAGLPEILASPTDNDILRAIVIRPERGAPLRGRRRGMRRLQPLHQRLPGRGLHHHGTPGPRHGRPADRRDGARGAWGLDHASEQPDAGCGGVIRTPT